MYIYVYVYVYMCVRLYTDVYVCIHIFIYVYTYVHLDKNWVSKVVTMSTHMHNQWGNVCRNTKKQRLDYCLLGKWFCHMVKIIGQKRRFFF